MRLRGAFAVSLLVHAGIAGLLILLPDAPVQPSREQVISVQLLYSSAQKDAPTAEPAASPRPAPATTPLVAIDSNTAISTAATEPHDWRREIRSAVRATTNDGNSLLQKPRHDPPALGAEREKLLSELDQGFKPLRRPLKICGGMVEIHIGAQEVTMPIRYFCEDKQIEYSTAPAAGSLIGEH